MAHSKLIAALAGPLLVAMGIALLLNRETMLAMASEIARSTGLVFLSGILSLLAGIAILRVHNVWSGGWPVIVTVLGWFAVIGGVLRMWAPQLAGPVAATLNANPTIPLVAGVTLSALGAFLSFKAYGPSA